MVLAFNIEVQGSSEILHYVQNDVDLFGPGIQLWYSGVGEVA
jgi:hypothetical protein